MDPVRGNVMGLNRKPSPIRNAQFQADVKARGQEIFTALESEGASIFNKDWWYGRIMEWSMKNEHFKTQMFRFVDVLPYLNDSSEVAKHLKEYFSEKGGQLPSIFNIGVGVGALAPGLMAGAVKKNIQQMARMFITGESPEEALPALKKARKTPLCFTADLLGEATLSESEAKEYFQRYQMLINDLAKDAGNWPEVAQIDRDENGEIPRVNVSVKLTSLYSQIRDSAFEKNVVILKDRIRPLLRNAKEKNVFINVDMEQYEHKDLTLTVFKEIVMEDEFRNYPHFGIVIQAYLRDAIEDCQKLVEFARKRGTPFTIRLVKGAYWDFEVIHAQQQGWPLPVYTIKKESDLSYELCAEELIKAYPHIRVAIGSHNVRSIAACMVLAERYKVPREALEVQMLFGMAEPIKKAIVKKGYRLREYATIGELIPGMAYLVRRLLENTSNESFLRSKFADNVSSEQLLADPAEGLIPSSENQPHNPDLFYNQSALDFTLEDNRRKMREALAEVRRNFGKTYALIINGQEKRSSETFDCVNPSLTSEIIARISAATIEDTEAAIQSSKKAYVEWSRRPVEERAHFLNLIADGLEKERFRLCAIACLEVGKTWDEADGEICEAIDFCRYYARRAVKQMKPSRTGHAPGELSLYGYLPRGVCAVIAPWNFPLAILAGMVTGALVTGNTVVMKPAEQSSVIAAEFMNICMKVGLPAGVLNMITGYGEIVGEYLTSHQDISLIAFTGSKAVGLRILEKASHIQPGQINAKKCIIEMGGKNAIIVDSDADLDEAVIGVLNSAFRFQGQKCSACSRVIVLNSNFDRFIDRLKAATESLVQGSSENPESFLGPVIDKEAFDRIQATIERNRSQTKLLHQGTAVQGGYYVPPTIFVDVDPRSELAQEEIFGPVLSVIRAKDLDDALRIANDTVYGLTGGIYSRSPANIEKVKTEYLVGNLYINRGITGALVERHPFGGFKMSGLGSKTGGKDYLLQFVDPRVVTENTLRRGFAPPEAGDA